jgi:hypothetical protein
MPFAILMATGIAAALISRRVVVATALLVLLGAHVAWIVLGGEATSEDSTATLIALSAVYLYLPALVGLIGGILIGHAAARGRDSTVDTDH